MKPQQLIMRDFSSQNWRETNIKRDPLKMAQAAMLGFEVAVITVMLICGWFGI